jgi:hypothetical protein
VACFLQVSGNAFFWVQHLFCGAKILCLEMGGFEKEEKNRSVLREIDRLTWKAFEQLYEFCLLGAKTQA